MVSQLAIDVENIGFRYPGNSEMSFSQLNLKVAKGVRLVCLAPMVPVKPHLLAS
jgi:ABC-2 type transport system ATP-binding protein